jgi:hypothetical protein
MKVTVREERWICDVKVGKEIYEVEHIYNWTDGTYKTSVRLHGEEVPVTSRIKNIISDVLDELEAL